MLARSASSPRACAWLNSSTAVSCCWSSSTRRNRFVTALCGSDSRATSAAERIVKLLLTSGTLLISVPRAVERHQRRHIGIAARGQRAANLGGQLSVEHFDRRQLQIHVVPCDFHWERANPILFALQRFARSERKSLLVQRAGHLGLAGGVAKHAA